jgi:arginine:agmatine antiporter
MLRNRKIGLVLATALVASNMIGSGIFLLPASLAAVGSMTMIGWGIALIGALAIAGVFARLGQIAPEAGGPCAYAADALGRYIGFQSNAIYWVSNIAGNVAISLAVVGYAAHFFPALATPSHTAIAASAAIWLLTLVNIIGPRFACQVESLTLAVGLIPLVLVGSAGWWFFDGETFRASWNVTQQPLHEVVPNSLVLVFWAFLGLESASVGTAIVENPKRNVPLATLGGVLLAGIVYMATCGVIMGLLPAATLAKSTAPFADAAQLIIGPVAGALVAIAALLKAGGTLCGWVLLNAQLSKAAAERGFFPSVLTRVDGRGVPVINLLLQAVVMSALVFATMSPTLNQQFNKLIEVAVILSLMTFVYGCMAMWHFNQPRSYQALAFLAMAFCLAVIVMSGTQLLALTAGIVLATSLAYPLVMKKTPLSRLRKS